MGVHFKDKIVVVTGGTAGIGRAMAAHLLQEGAYVAVCARSQQSLYEMRTALQSNNLLVIPADVSIEQDCQSFINQVIAAWGGIDVLINNAGISMKGDFRDTGTDVIRKVMDINFMGMVYCTKFALESIIQRKGSIVGISSIAGYRGLPGRSGYSASKFAMNGWLEALRTELYETGVNVMWASPGFTKSNIRQVALMDGHQIQGKSPLNEDKLMTPEACASQILQAIQNRNRTLVMTFQGKRTVFLNKLFPGLADRLARTFFYKDGQLVK